MDCSCSTTELRMFIGCLNYNCDMWPSRAHILQPLTDQSGLKKKYLLNGQMKCKKGFDKMRLLIAANALAAYLDNNKWFNIYTNASAFQLGACIIQEGRLVAYFSHKLTNLSKTILPWKKKCILSSHLLKNFEVCSLAQTFMFSRIIKT
jgi:hypothetical protein